MLSLVVIGFAFCYIEVSHAQSCTARSGTECNITTHGSADDMNLLQLHGPPSLHSGISTVSSIEKNVMHLAKNVVHGQEPLSENTLALLKNMDTEMKTIIDGAAENRNLLQTDVDAAKVEIAACTANAMKGHSKAGGVDFLAAEVASARSAHTDCRDQEKNLHKEKTSLCDGLSRFVTGLQRPDCFNATVEAMNQEAFKECGEKHSTFFETSTKVWAEKAKACSDSTSAHATKREDCGVKQMKMQMDFCLYGSSLANVCSEQEDCMATQISARNKVHEHVKVAEEALKAHYRSAVNVRCVMGVFTSEDAKKLELLNKCTSADVDRSFLNVTYHNIPEAAACDLSPISSKPCDDEWVRQELADQSWSAEAPAHPCVSCPAPTTSTTSIPSPALTPDVAFNVGSEPLSLPPKSMISPTFAAPDFDKATFMWKVEWKLSLTSLKSNKGSAPVIWELQNGVSGPHMQLHASGALGGMGFTAWAFKCETREWCTGEGDHPSAFSSGIVPVADGKPHTYTFEWSKKAGNTWFTVDGKVMRNIKERAMFGDYHTFQNGDHKSAPGGHFAVGKLYYTKIYIDKE